MRISAIQLIGQFPVRQSVSKYGRGAQNTDSFDVDTFVSFGVQRVYPKEAPAMVCLEKVKSRGGIVPKRVEDLVREYAKDEALKDLTLTEVHKIAYADLKKCKTLTEAKKLFPEFECVKHLDELSAKEGSIIYGLQIGDVEVKPCGEETDDEALKLLQYIWSELYSSSNTAIFTRNKSENFYTTWSMQGPIARLKIPLLNYEYAQSLRFESRPRQRS